jgi:hypothetical protein
VPLKDSIALALAPTKSFFRLSAPFMLVLEAVAQGAPHNFAVPFPLSFSTFARAGQQAQHARRSHQIRHRTISSERPSDHSIPIPIRNLSHSIPRSGRPTPLPPILFISTPFSALSFRNYPRSLSSPQLPIGPLSPSGNARSFLVLHVVLFVHMIPPSPRGSTNRSWAGVAVVKVSVFITVHDTHSARNYYIR